jgi:hypothetical protein
MDLVSRMLLVLVYGLVVPVRLVRILLRRDTLTLRRPINAQSYWVVREAQPDALSYFSESSAAEGRPPLREDASGHRARGAAPLFTPLLRTIARFRAPPHEPRADKYAAHKYAEAAGREQGIPDEVYTLW